MTNMSMGKSTLYLYCQDDPMVDPVKLDELIAARKARGAQVEYKRWDRSRHVGHYFVHYVEYKNTLEDYLKRMAAARLG
jgi:hypothetical protein